MWTADMARRALLDLILTGGGPPTGNQLRDELFQPTVTSGFDAKVWWARRPEQPYDLPVLAVFQTSEQAASFIGSVNATTSGISPLTSVCRVLSRSEAADAVETTLRPVAPVVLAMLGLSTVEALVHGMGRIEPRQISVAAARRTLSYVWASALSVGSAPNSIERLPQRWLECYEYTNSSEAANAARMVLRVAIGPLSVLTLLALSLNGSGPIFQLAQAVVRRDFDEAKKAWTQLSKALGLVVSLESLAGAPREERAGYLQLAFSNMPTSGASDDNVCAACAFLASQVAPSSTEHLLILLNRIGPRAAMWYGMFVALQAPMAMFSANPAVGARLARDVERDQGLTSPPDADLSFAELQLVARIGLDDFPRRLAHSSEIEVELLPLVKGAFRLGPRSNQLREPGQQSLIPPEPVPKSPRERLAAVMAELASVLSTLPPEEDPPTSPQQRGRPRRRT